MEKTNKIIKSLEKIARATNLPEPKKRLTKAKDFLKEVLERDNGNLEEDRGESVDFTRYSISIEYGPKRLRFLGLEIYFMDDDPGGHRETESCSSITLFGRRR